MLSNPKAKARHEARNAEMRARMSLPKMSPKRQEREAQRAVDEREQRAHERSREEWRFTLMGRHLDREARELAEERYVTALYGIRTSWKAIERFAIYFIWRSRTETRTRKYLSTRPAWGFNLERRIDRHHMASKVVPIRPPLRPGVADAPAGRAA